KVARAGSRKTAPGEAVRETGPLPAPGTQVRVAARARVGGRVSALSPVVSLAVQAPLAAPKDLEAELVAKGVAVEWTPPPGGIPPPIARPSPSPSPSPTPPPRAPAPPAASAGAPASPIPPGASPAPTSSP